MFFLSNIPRKQTFPCVNEFFEVIKANLVSSSEWPLWDCIVSAGGTCKLWALWIILKALL